MRSDFCSLELYDLVNKSIEIDNLPSWYFAPFLQQLADKLGCNFIASISRIIEKQSICKFYYLYQLRLKLLIELEKKSNHLINF